MVKKLRRVILKKNIEKKLFWYLRNLNLLGNEHPELTIVEENSLGITFSLKSEKQLFSNIHFSDIGSQMNLIVDIDGLNTLERITFSVSKRIDLIPKAYHIHQKNNHFNIKQKIDFNSGKISLFMAVEENNVIDLKNNLVQLLEQIAEDLYDFNTNHVNIICSDFFKKHFWITQEVEKAVLRPESSINFSNFYKLKNIF